MVLSTIKTTTGSKRRNKKKNKNKKKKNQGLQLIKVITIYPIKIKSKDN
jgi:hypothetical protein